MRLLSLDIRNFRVIRETHLSFPDSVIGIIGPNGAGKSSIVESIAWALYGTQAARSGRDEVKSTMARSSDNCEVALRFQVNGEPYRIVRRLAGKTERVEVELYRGDSSESVGSMETRDYITELLGLDWRGFLTSFLARQQELNALSDLQPAKRREHLAGMLGIERLDKALQAVKEDTRVSREKADFIKRSLQEKDLVSARIEELREHIASLGREHEVHVGACKAAESVMGDIRERFESEQKKKDRCSVLAARITAEQKSGSYLKDQLESLIRERTVLLESRGELDSLKSELAKYDGVRHEVETLKEAASRTEYRTQVEKRRLAIDLDLKKLAERVSEIETESASVQSALAAVSDNIETVHKQAEEELEKAREEYLRANGRRETLVNDRRKAHDQVEQINQIGPDTVCDRCHRPFGSDLPKIREHLETDLARLDDAVRESEEKLAAIKKTGEQLKQLVTELSVQVSARRELGIRRDNVSRELKGLTEQRLALSKEQSDVVAKLEEIGPVSFDPARLDQLKSALSELEVKRARYQQLSGSLMRLPAVEREIGSAREKIALAECDLATLNAEMQEIGFDQREFDTVAAKFADAQAKLESEKTALVKLGKELEVMTRELEVKQEQMAGYKKAEEELETCVSGQYYGEKLSSLFAEFRKQLIAGIRPRLAELSSTLFADMTDGKYSLVDLDRDYNLQIMDYGQMFGINRYSGGEKDLANLCLRLAISLALTESAGLQRSFVILDEVFGSQDEGRRELIFQGLAKLRDRFPQIFLITHIDELKDKVETLIQVNPTSSGWSEVRVNGEVA